MATATGHVVAAFFQLYHCTAVRAALPALLLCNLNEAFGLFVVGTFSCRMPFAVARAADFGLASGAFTILPAMLSAKVTGFDPFTTAFGRTVNTVLRSVFPVFIVPLHLELEVEELVDMF